MLICKLKVNHCEDRASLVSILAFAGYRVSIENQKSGIYSFSSDDYFVVVEDKEAAHD